MLNSPERHVNQILQCLIQDKKSISFLLGAGCPFSIKTEAGEPLIPDISGLTKLINDKMLQAGKNEHWQRLCKSLEDDYKPSPNIEQILSSIRGLANFAGNGEVRGFTKSELVTMESLICNAIKDCVSATLPNQSTPYHNLGLWASSIPRAEPIEIFTTNYDLLLEEAFEDLRIPFFDGFIGAKAPFFDPYTIEFEQIPARWVRLWKVHGSINWRSKSETEIKVWRSLACDDGELLIHPSHLKYDQSRKMPYLALIERMRKSITRSSSLMFTLGYSFNDEHINEVMLQALQGSPSSAVIALLYGNLDGYVNACNIAKKRSNLSLLANDGCIIGCKQGKWGKVAEKPDEVHGEVVVWSKESDELWIPSLKLGDFKIFGDFLRSICGNAL